MLQTKENTVKIEGILSEIDIKYGSFKKNGTDVNSVGGTIKVQVNQKINGVDTELEIPVHLFASQYTNAGALNPAYESIEKVMKEYTSIAASDIDHADRIRITRGQLQMNEYYGQNGNLVSFPRVTASFISKIKKDECKPDASFTVVFMVGSKGYETDKDGVETDKYKITGIVPQYGGKVDVVPFIAINKGVIDAVSNYWNEGDTVKAAGKLNFTSRTETHMSEVDFGEPVEETRTYTVSEHTQLVNLSLLVVLLLLLRANLHSMQMMFKQHLQHVKQNSQNLKRRALQKVHQAKLLLQVQPISLKTLDFNIQGGLNYGN